MADQMKGQIPGPSGIAADQAEESKVQSAAASELQHSLPAGPEKQDRDLWENIKHVHQKVKGSRLLPIIESQQEEKPERLLPDANIGLTAAQAAERAAAGAVNKAVESASKTTREIIFSNVFTYFNLIFFIITVLLCIVGSFRDLTYLVVVISNTLIGIIQEIRAKKVLDDLRILGSPKCLVLRDRSEQKIPADQIVVDDIVILAPGNQVVADMTIVEGIARVNESLLTGESDQIEKGLGDVLLSGSFIVSGSCRARVDKVGADAFAAQLAQEAKKMSDEESSEMIRALDRLVRGIGIIIIPIGLILFGQQYFINHTDMRTSVTSTVAAIVGMIPEGLYLLASVALVVSVMRLAMQKVLVHNMKCIETLARVDILCVDKTGTITDNTMEVKGFYPLQGEEFSENEKKEVELALGDFVSSMAADTITMKAMKERFRKRGGKRPEQVFPFSYDNKYSGALFGEEMYVLGAPEFLLMDTYPLYEEQISSYAVLGYRVLVFGRYGGNPDGGKLTEAVTPIAMILLANPVRENASETFSYFAEQGVQVKVISGDNPLTVSEVAKEAGILNAENYIDLSAVTSDEEIRNAALQYTVFGRVSPDQKRQLISAMKHAGHTVAMTGDGVNDVLALKDADCSIAMATGSDAACQVAQLVLLESDFSRMPSVVAEGRRVVNNIERTASLFLVKNIFSLFLSIFSIVLAINYPMEPSQVSLISMFTIGIPAFLLSQENNTERIRGRFLNNVLFKALPGGLTDFLIVSCLYLFCLEFRLSEAEISTSSTILLAIVGLIVLYQIASPMTRIHWVIWTAMAAGLIYCMFFVSSIFGITMISKRAMMLLALFAIVTEPCFRYLSILMRWISRKHQERKAKQA